MEAFPFEIEYQITLGDFRRASYYGLFLRYRRPLRLLFLVLLSAALYCVAALLAGRRVHAFVPLLAGAYLVWGLFLFAGTEKGIRTYLRRGDSLIGCTYRTCFDKKQLRIQVRERKIDVYLPLAKLACVFEISGAFLVYTSIQEVYIIPVRAMTEQQHIAMRAHFRKSLGSRFGSRFR